VYKLTGFINIEKRLRKIAAVSVFIMIVMFIYNWIIGKLDNKKLVFERRVASEF
jgi:hypothetical protein